MICLATLLLAISGVAGPGDVQPPTRHRLPLPRFERNSAEFRRYKEWVDGALSGNRPYAFEASDAAFFFRVTGDRRYASLAISMTDEMVRKAETEIAAGHRPAVAGDSYLYAGPYLYSLAATYDWAGSRVTAAQKARWEAFADRTLENIWNPTKARWGDTPATWSGWSVANPGNNYHFSFLLATMSWALAGERDEWLRFLREDKLPKLVEYYRELPGGGSREGTGYGLAQAKLFEIYRLWRDATGEDLAARSPHLVETISYWVHATVPTLDRVAPIGDQARDSTASLFDYHRALVLQAVSLAPEGEERKLGRWWLAHIVRRQMQHGFNFRDELAPWKGPQAAPRALMYQATGAGVVFARSSWSQHASWVSFLAGPYLESHAHQDQGAFNIYKDKWLAVTENIHTHSGIAQATPLHNIVRFEKKDGTPIAQASPARSLLMSVEDTGGVLTLVADLTPAYAPTPGVKKWHRRLTFDGRRVVVKDSCDLDPSLTPVWQVNVPAKPRVRGDTVFAGDLAVRPVTPKQPEVKLVDWSPLNPREYLGGWRVELRGGSEFEVELWVRDGERRGAARTPGQPQPAPPNGERRGAARTPGQPRPAPPR
jgi:hypothetical protein